VDINDEIDDIAFSEDARIDNLRTFIKEDLPTCKGYVLIWIDSEDRVSHSRWNMRPWKVRGAMTEITSGLLANNVVDQLKD
jgi:hypothetical protein